jgi:hypothetical protein
MSREVRAARVEIEKGVDGVARSVAEIQVALRRAERKIELRKEAKAQLAVLRARRREATRTLRRLSTAAGGSWRDVKKAADRTLTDARAVAESVIERFRRAVRE